MQKEPHEEADFALFHAAALLIVVLKNQNLFFSLDLDDEISACERDLFEVWIQPKTTS